MPINPVPSLLFPATLFFLAACAQPRMVPPDDVAKGTILDAKNRSRTAGLFAKEDFDLGPYRVAKVDRSWIHGSGSGFGAYSSTSSNATYSYELRGGAQAWKGNCSIAKDEKNLKLTVGTFGRSTASLNCECADGTRTGHLELTRSHSDNFEGTLVPGGQAYTLRPVTKTDRKFIKGNPAGYRIDGADGPRGAVEILNPGRIWFTEQMPETEREPGACLLAGLMLYTEPDDQHPD